MVALSCFGVAGCAPSEGSPAAATTTAPPARDPCTFFSTSDAMTVFGGPIGNIHGQNTGSQPKVCTFTTLEYQTVAIGVWPTGFSRADFDAAAKAAGPKMRVHEGLGEAAYLNSSDHTLMVMKSGVAFQVSSPNDAMSLNVAIQLLNHL